MSAACWDGPDQRLGFAGCAEHLLACGVGSVSLKNGRRQSLTPAPREKQQIAGAGVFVVSSPLHVVFFGGAGGP